MTDMKKILVIDDDPDIITYMTMLLEDNGYAVVAAHDGQVGIDKAKTERPDLILLDITMPEKSGVKCYREIRDDQDLKSVPVVILTGVTEEFRKFIYSRKQVPPPDGYISKPASKQELLETVSQLLSRE